MKIEENPIATFSNREEALTAIELLNDYTYELRHGEHSRPDYTARKVRGEDAYYIHAKRYYYAGTFYAVESGPLRVNDQELFIA